MEQTVLVWIPLGFLWICAPSHLISLFGRCTVENKHLSKLYICKQVIKTWRPEAKDSKESHIYKTNELLSMFPFKGKHFLACLIYFIYLWVSFLVFLSSVCGISVVPDSHRRLGTDIRGRLRSNRGHPFPNKESHRVPCKPYPVCHFMGKHSSCYLDFLNCSWGDYSLCNVVGFPRQALVLLCQEGVRRREGTVDSATLFIFWLLIILCQIFPFQSLVRKALGVWDPASFLLLNHLVGYI